MNAPRLLDLFCCAGGAGMGYHRAGFEVTGVDIAFQPRYPFAFVQSDALEYLAEHGDEYDVIHASPPCQSFTAAQRQSKNSAAHPDLVDPTRQLLIATGKPWVIENVPGAPLRDYIQLCGTAFNLRATDTDGEPLQLRRHRWFESSEFLWGPPACNHDRNIRTASVYGHGGGWDRIWRDHPSRAGGYVPHRTVCAELLGIDWPMKKRELSESIPPAFTEWIGRQLIASLDE